MKIGIIIGSIRDGRNGEAVANWVGDQADQRRDAEYELIDLKAFNVPLLASATVPGAADKQYDSPEVTAWSRAVDACDGFVFVTPEYNHGVPGGFKNAFDSLGAEWADKSVGFVSYGAEGGIRAVEQWRTIIANFHMTDIRAQVAFNLFTDFGADGFAPNDRKPAHLGAMLDELVAKTAKLVG